MTRRFLLFVLFAGLAATLSAASGKTKIIKQMKPIHDKSEVMRSRSFKKSSEDKQGVTAALKYEQIADMTTARMSHQLLPSGNGFVAVGGRTTGFQLTRTAEIYQNGTWSELPISSPHDGAFSVKLGDGRFMVGGGFSAAGGVGQSKSVDIYDPSTRIFVSGPDLKVSRAMSKAISVGSYVYVSGNWYGDDAVMDCYDGTTFTTVGNMDGRSNPYLFSDSQGIVYSLAATDTKGASFGFYTHDDGSQALLADMYDPATGETKYLVMPFTPEFCPLALSDDVRVEDYHIAYDGENYYFILARQGAKYSLCLFAAEEQELYSYTSFDIPSVDPVTGEAISYRSGVIVNQAKGEVYLIGTSGQVTNQRLHIISLNYLGDEWTIASASGFHHNMLTASWTLLNDGRLACSGGGINDNRDAQPTAYIFTTPVAGQGNETPDDPQEKGNTLVVLTKDGVETTFLLSEKPEVRFADTSLRVVSTKADVTYQLSDILRFTYLKKSSTGIDDIVDNSAEVDYQEGTLVISRLKANDTVGIYSLDGALVRQLTAERAGTYRLNLAPLPQGVYVVKAGNTSYKIMKR